MNVDVPIIPDTFAPVEMPCDVSDCYASQQNTVIMLCLSHLMHLQLVLMSTTIRWLLSIKSQIQALFH